MISVDFYNDQDKQTLAINDAKQLFGEHTPYTIVPTADVDQIVFYDHFTENVRTALSNGCVINMSKYELALFRDFIAWQNWLIIQDPVVVAGSEEDVYVSDEKDALIALNNWLVDELSGIPHYELNTCNV